MQKLDTKGDRFMLDGKPFRILAGAMHYFRVMPEYWRDRFRKMRMMGLNTVETYVCWNLHEPRPGEFDFSGRLDLIRYLEIAREEGLYSIVRPGPYICSEWDMGALPWWLLKNPAMRLRCHNEPYLSAVHQYLNALLPRLAPLQSTCGGPILMMQIENEYGSYGNDKEYLAWLEQTFKSLGVNVMLFTSDGGTDLQLLGGSLPHILKTVNFGSKPTENFATLKRHQSDKPLMCAEFWNGWFDHWGGEHHIRDPKDSATALDGVLSSGASVSLYMFHGGTNFGFTAGANCLKGDYQPDVGSYDNDAPLDEAGDPTPKFHSLREVISRYSPIPDIPVPPPSLKAAYGKVRLGERAALLNSLASLSAPIRSNTPEPMEQYDQGYGLILYQTRLNGPLKAGLSVIGLADRAVVLLDGERKGVLSRQGIRKNDDEKQISLDIPPHGATLDLLVEAMGRVNFSVNLADRKGITGGVLLDKGQFIYDWTVFPLPLNDLSGLVFRPDSGSLKRPTFLRGTFEIKDTPRDTFLLMAGWDKGICWINGFNLGRHWNIGPQMTHYVPAPLLRKGTNEIVVLELDRMADAVVTFIDRPVLSYSIDPTKSPTVKTA